MERYARTITGKAPYIFPKGSNHMKEKMIILSQEVPCPPLSSTASSKDPIITMSDTNQSVLSLHLISNHSSDSDIGETGIT